MIYLMASTLLTGPVDPWTPIPPADVATKGGSWAASWGGSGGGAMGPGKTTKLGGAEARAGTKGGGIAEGGVEPEATGRELTWLLEINPEI